MSESKPNRRIKLHPSILISGLLGLISFLVWFDLEGAQEEGGYPLIQTAILWILFLVFILLVGNLLIYRLLRDRFPWESSFNSRFFLQLLLTLIYSVFCINASYILFKNVYTQLPPDEDQMILLNIYGTLFLIPVLSIQFGLLFLSNWKKAILEKEDLKNEQIQSELIALKSHISPHFLFNNLSILSSMIELENDVAHDYLDRFAEVYRYVLRNRQIELVALSEELNFLNSYRYLLQKRFPSGLEITIDVPDKYMEFYLPSLSLQLLLENALKHNRISDTQPLKVDIGVKESGNPFLIVQNNLQAKSVTDREKSGFGLENIRRRYWLIARRNIEISDDDEYFRVILPLLSQSNRYADIDHRG